MTGSDDSRKMTYCSVNKCGTTEESTGAFAKTGRAWIAILAAILFAMAFFAATAEGAEADTIDDYSYYDGAKYKGTVLISYPEGKSADVVRIREDCTQINPGAFRGCGQIGKVVIPDGCNVDKGSFLSSGVASLEISESNRSIRYDDGVIFSPDGGELWAYLGGRRDTSYQVPEAVTVIRREAFKGNPYIRQILIGDTVNVIGGYAFQNCTALERIWLPRAIDTKACEQLGTIAFAGEFAGCTSLKEVKLPEGVEMITIELFEGCEALDRVEIPESAQQIKEAALWTGGAISELIVHSKTLEPAPVPGNDGEPVKRWARCLPVVPGTGSMEPNQNYQPKDGDITYIYAHPDSAIAAYLTDASRLSGTNPEAYTIAFRNIEAAASDQPDHGTCGENLQWSASADGKTLTISGTGEMVNYFFNSTTEAPWMWRYGNTIEQLIIEEGITSVGMFAFYGMPNLKSVSLPQSLTTVNQYAFSNCDSLAAVTFPGSVSLLDRNAFAYNDSLSSVAFLQNVGEIKGSFEGCTALTKVSFGAAVSVLSDWAFAGCSALQKLDLSNVEQLGSFFCAQCRSLKKIYISKVQSIWSAAFSEANTTVYYTSEVPEELIGKNYGGTLQWTPIAEDTPDSGDDEPSEPSADAFNPPNPSALTKANLAQRCNDTYGYRYICDQLQDRNMQALYEEIDKIEAAFFRGSTDLTASTQLSVICNTLTEDQIRQVYSTYHDDHPLYFWMAEEPQIAGAAVKLVCGSDYLTAAARTAALQRIATAIGDYVSYCDGSTSAYTYASASAYRMAQQTVFDSSAEDDSQANSIIGVFGAQRRATGKGYARAYQLLLNYFGVSCRLVHGKAGAARSDHAWNLVQMEDGCYYRVDPAYCDADLAVDYGTYGKGDGYAAEKIERFDNVRDNPHRMNYIYLLRGSAFTGFDEDHTAFAAGSGPASLCILPDIAEKDYVPQIEGIRAPAEVKHRNLKTYDGSSEEFVNDGETDFFQYMVVQNDGLHRQVEIRDSYARTGTEVSIPAEVSIQGLTYTVAGVNLVSIGAHVETVRISEGVRYIRGTFNNERAVTKSIFIPSTVECIQVPNLSEICLREIQVADDNPYICSVDGVLYNKDQTTLIRYPVDKTGNAFTVPETVTSIYPNAFRWNKRLWTVVMGNHVKYINICAFSETALMRELTIPSSVSLLPRNVFYESTSLQAIYLSKKTSFTEETFTKCTASLVEVGGEEPEDPNPGEENGSGESGTSSGSTVTNPAKQQIRGTLRYTKTIGQQFRLNTSAKTKMTYRSSNPAVATVNAQGLVKVRGYGTCIITVTAAASKDYQPATCRISITAQLANPILKGSNKSGKRIKLSWSRVEGADGYQLFVKLPGKKKFIPAISKSARVKSVTHRGLVKKKKYSYRLRAYKIVGSTTVYSPWSKTITVKVKK